MLRGGAFWRAGWAGKCVYAAWPEYAYDGQITDGDIARAYVEHEIRLAADALSTFPPAVGLEGVINKQQARALAQARRVQVAGDALHALATESGTDAHAFLERGVGGSRARVQDNMHMTVARRACRGAVLRPALAHLVLLRLGAAVCPLRLRCTARRSICRRATPLRRRGGAAGGGVARSRPSPRPTSRYCSNKT